MDFIKGKIAVVTGGNRGFGRGIAEALAAKGAKVFTVSRRPSEQPSAGITEVIGDATDETLRDSLFARQVPDLLILSAGIRPQMMAPQEQTWEAISAVWNNDLKHSVLWSQKAMLAPMKPGSTILVVSSGAAIQGSSLSGGYAGAKRMQWFFSNYLQQESDKLGLGLRFRALVPKALSPETEIGRNTAAAYAKARNVNIEVVFEGFGSALTTAGIGRGVLSILDRTSPEGRVYGITGKGLEVLES
jgi:NAD(P)-dependent dehydrogenase (short-subunit alcohol dehydrogenase family)